MGLLKVRISPVHKLLDHTSRSLLQTHLQLGQKLHPLIFDKIDALSKTRADDNARLTTLQQKKKFDLLERKQTPLRPKLDTDKVVINLSSHNLNQHATNALAKGLNFAVTPGRMPIEKIICGVESAIANLPEQTAEVVRQSVATTLHKAVLPTRNITTAEILAIKELRENDAIIILPADKGNSTVIMDTADYDAKMTTLLNDNIYKPTAKDPTVYLEKTTRSLIVNSSIAKETQGTIIPNEKSSRIPRLYGLPKIHKAGAPLRPIVSAIGGPTQALSRHLAKQLQPHAEEARSYVKNSSHFVELLREMRTTEDDLLVSFDVVSLFTKVPTTEALEIINEKYAPSEDTIRLARHCMSSTYFIYKGQFYKQVESAPMGSPLSPVAANLFMEDFETKALETADFKPQCWLRYVDDTFVIWRHGLQQLQEFHKHLNSIHPKIQFTMETEKDNKLAFLDVLV